MYQSVYLHYGSNGSINGSVNGGVNGSDTMHYVLVQTKTDIGRCLDNRGTNSF
jgi:hypothetical protein